MKRLKTQLVINPHQMDGTNRPAFNRMLRIFRQEVALLERNQDMTLTVVFQDCTSHDLFQAFVDDAIARAPGRVTVQMYTKPAGELRRELEGLCPGLTKALDEVMPTGLRLIQGGAQ